MRLIAGSRWISVVATVAALGMAAPALAQSRLFIQSEGADAVGKGGRYVQTGTMSIMPVLGGFTRAGTTITLPADNFIRIRTADGNIRFLFAAWNRAENTYGDLPLGCTPDAAQQCTAWYSFGLVPVGVSNGSSSTSYAFGDVSINPAAGGGGRCPAVTNYADARIRFAVLDYVLGKSRDITDAEITELTTNWGFIAVDLIDTTVNPAKRRQVQSVATSIDFEQVCATGNDFGRLFGSVRAGGGSASFPWIPGNAKLRGESTFQQGTDEATGSVTTILPDTSRIDTTITAQENFRRKYPTHVKESGIYLSGTDTNLGVGGVRLVKFADADFTAEPLNGDILKGVRVRGVGPGFNMVLDMGAAYNQPLHTNCYNLVCHPYAVLQRRSSKDDVTPGLDITLNSRQCNAIAGSMQVREAYFDGSTIGAFAADIDFQCNGGSNIRAEVRFNSDIPFADYDEDGIPDSEESSSRRARNEPDNYTVPQNTVDGSVLFVRQGYRDLADREASISAYTRDVFDLDFGVKSRSQFLYERFTSNEFFGITAPITRLYLGVFGRIPDVTGLNYWTTRTRSLVRPTNLLQIANLFVTSGEFAARYGAPDNRGFVRQLYLNVLGRPADSAGENFWTAELDAGRQTRAQMVTTFTESAENINLTFNTVNVVVAYYGLLRRDVSGNELGGYVSLLNNGTLTPLAMLEHMSRSKEYCERFMEVQFCRTATRTQVLTVARGGTGNGRITSSNVLYALNCGPTCTGEYPEGDVVTLTAIPNAGSSFTGWTGICAGQPATCSVTMSTARNVTANFSTP